MGSEVSSASAYFLDTLKLSDSVAVTVSGRYDDTRIELSDRSGDNPQLDGKHDYSRFNPAVGVTWRLAPAMTLYGSYGESTRAPSPVELVCASEDAPCNLPNAFLADPPLEQVVAKSAEIGLRSEGSEGLRWHVGGFYTRNRNDILFQTTGGLSGQCRLLRQRRRYPAHRYRAERVAARGALPLVLRVQLHRGYVRR